MQPIHVVHIGIELAEPGDGNGQVLYLLTICSLEFGQDERVPVHPAEDLSDADLLRLADAVDIGDLDRGRRGTFGHSVPVLRVGFGGRQQLTGGIRAVCGGIGLVDPQASLIILDDPDLRYRPCRRRLRRMGSWFRLSSSRLDRSLLPLRPSSNVWRVDIQSQGHLIKGAVHVGAPPPSAVLDFPSESSHGNL